jgi:Right handed beta helix region
MVAAAAGMSLLTDRAADAQTDRKTIYVDQRHVHAADDNPGTASLPLSTLTRAVAVASEANAAATPVQIVVRPGVYRESIRITPDERTTSAPVTIEGDAGGVIVSGADVWGGWTHLGNGVYSHPWSYDWGLAPMPPEWPESIRTYLEANPIIRRTEMVFVDGAPLRQVLSTSELEDADGRFFVSEDTDELFVHPPSSTTDLARSLVEVSTRPSLMVVGSQENITIRNIEFERAANAVGGPGAVFIADSRNVEVIDCDFTWNNGSGLSLYRGDEITVRGIEANHNGVGGFTGFGIRGLRVYDSEASFNGWRAASGWDANDHSSVLDMNFIDFGAGQKFFRLRDASFHGFRATDNLTGGLWLDYDNSGVSLVGLTLNGNLTHGLFVEASQGPISIEASQLCRNETGILVGNASNVTAVQNVIAMNGLAQIFFAGEGERIVDIHDTGQSISVGTRDWRIQANRIDVTDASVAVGTHLDHEDWQSFISSSTSEANRYSSVGTDEIFQLPGGRTLTLSQWIAETGQDSGSSFVASDTACPMPAGRVRPERSWGSTLLIAVLWTAFAVGTALVIWRFRPRREP